MEGNEQQQYKHRGQGRRVFLVTGYDLQGTSNRHEQGKQILQKT